MNRSQLRENARNQWEQAQNECNRMGGELRSEAVLLQSDLRVARDFAENVDQAIDLIAQGLADDDPDKIGQADTWLDRAESVDSKQNISALSTYRRSAQSACSLAAQARAAAADGRSGEAAGKRMEAKRTYEQILRTLQDPADQQTIREKIQALGR